MRLRRWGRSRYPTSREPDVSGLDRTAKRRAPAAHAAGGLTLILLHWPAPKRPRPFTSSPPTVSSPAGPQPAPASVAPVSASSIGDRPGRSQTEVNLHKRQFRSPQSRAPRDQDHGNIGDQKLDFLGQPRTRHQRHFVVKKRQIREPRSDHSS